MRGRAGFTLLEMLIAVAITAALVATAVQIYLNITRHQERARGGVRRDRNAQVFLDRLERELWGALLVVKTGETDRLSHPWVFVGIDRFGASHESDALIFITRSPARAEGIYRAYGLRRVSYSVETNADDALELVRREDALPEGMSKEIPATEGQPVLTDLASFSLRYLPDETAGLEATELRWQSSYEPAEESDLEWRESWDSTDIAFLDRLPEAVEVSVRLWEQDESGETVEGDEHLRVIELRVRPFDLEALREGPDAGDGTDCETPASCVAAFHELVDAAPADVPQDIWDELERSDEECFDPESEVAALLRGLGGDPDAECAP
jgi:type II secretion system protein J